MAGAGSANVPIKVQVWPTFREAAGSVLGQLGLFLHLAWLPWLINVVFALWLQLAILVLRAPDAEPHIGELATRFLITLIVQVLCSNAFLVRWYQAVLYPNPDAWTRELFWQGYRRFLLYVAIIYGATVALLIGLGGSGLLIALLGSVGAAPDDSTGPLGLLGLIGLGALYGWIIRCALIFPAAAYGRPLGFRAALLYLRGNTWRLIGAELLGAGLTGFAAIPTVIAAVFLGSVIWAVSSGGTGPLPDAMANSFPVAACLSIGQIAIAYFGLAIFASILSIFYRDIVLRPASGAVNISV